MASMDMWWGSTQARCDDWWLQQIGRCGGRCMSYKGGGREGRDGWEGGRRRGRGGGHGRGGQVRGGEERLQSRPALRHRRDRQTAASSWATSTGPSAQTPRTWRQGWEVYYYYMFLYTSIIIYYNYNVILCYIILYYIILYYIILCISRGGAGPSARTPRTSRPGRGGVQEFPTGN